MNLLLIPASYPHPAAEWAGVNNEHSAVALRPIVEHIEVLSPRPYAPRLLAFNDRWRGYVATPKKQVRKGITVHHPAYPRIPGVLQGFWPTMVAFMFSRRLATTLHREIGFDAILSFDLAKAGGLAWRLGRLLGIRACGWATGGDMRWDARTAVGSSVRDTLRHLDLVFYQSAELKALAAGLLEVSTDALSEAQHVVQARGIIEPKVLPGERVRRLIRSQLQLSDHQIVILYVGRIVRGKGLFDLVDGFSHWGRKRRDLTLVLVGARPGYDDTPELQSWIESIPELNERIRILPGCPPEKIWGYFSAADIFVFPSFREGMPNSLLEAMVARLPAVAFGIAAVQEIARFGKGLVEVPPYDFAAFGEGILSLAAEPSLRREIGERGRTIAREHFSIQKNMRVIVDHIRALTAR